MKKHIYILAILLTHLSNCVVAKTGETAKDNNIYKTFKLDLETTACTEIINKDEILLKEFSGTNFSLDLKNNLLMITESNKEKVKVIGFTLNNSKIVFKDQEEYGKIEAYITFENELPVFKFKDHSDDCFFFVINFSN